jgi:23S rRNA (pseudouridine1915-N3)-methyltransferase
MGKTRSAAVQALTDEYLKRLGRYVEVEGTVLKDEASLLKLGRQAKPRYLLVLMDARGKQFSSEEFANWLREHRDRSALPLAFGVGSADGFSREHLQAADMVISLGKMTLPHELARVVLLEQLYRAFTILEGHPYHVGH